MVAGLTSGVAAYGLERSVTTTGAVTLWGNARPADATVDSDRTSVELGTAFRPTTDGTAVGVRFYKTQANSGVHVGNVWAADGTRLATAQFTSETSSGWQTGLLRHARCSSPPANATSRPTWRRAAATCRPRTSGGAATTSLLAVDPGRSGVYAYGKRSSFPTKSWNHSQYWVDVVFVPVADTSTGQLPAPDPTPTP